jgi:hypothetical protein
MAGEEDAHGRRPTRAHQRQQLDSAHSGHPLIGHDDLDRVELDA